MDGILGVLLVGVTGWLTGKVIGEKGYAKALGGYATNGLDIVLGILGASIGGYLFFWVAVGEGSLFSRYATAVLGSITLVGFSRLIPERYLPSSSG